MNKEIDIIDFVEKIGFQSIRSKFVKRFNINESLPIYELYHHTNNIISSNNKEDVIKALKHIFNNELRKYKINKFLNEKLHHRVKNKDL